MEEKTVIHSYHKVIGTITKLIPLGDAYICKGFERASLTLSKKDVHTQEIKLVNLPDLLFPKIAKRVENGAIYLLGATNDKSYGPIPKIVIIDLKYVNKVEYFGESETSYYFKVTYHNDFENYPNQIKDVLLSDISAI